MPEVLRQVSVVFLIKENEVLLAMKKRGFGKGRWNGAGGKPDPGEQIETTAVRECQEEINVTPRSLRKVAILDFYFPKEKANKGFNQQAHVFLCDDWDGEPSETEEMRPKWFSKDKIPYNEMWSDDIYWLPRILGRECIKGEFYFDDFDQVVDFDIKPLSELS